MHDFQRRFTGQSDASDKITHHGYQRVYPWFFGHFVSKEIDLLEIGIDKTKSLKLWKDYFPKVRLYGIDKDEKQFSDDDVRLFRVDQSEPDELRKFRATVGTEFDIIVDDGSHVPAHQLLTLNELWVLLRPGGIYVIEDIETSYWGKSEIYGYQFDSSKESIITFAIQLINDINSEFRPTGSMKEQINSPLVNDVELVTFAHNCVVMVKKNPESFSRFYNREYAMLGCVNYHSPWRRFRRWLRRWLK
jgi:hypothetical protein